MFSSNLELSTSLVDLLTSIILIPIIVKLSKLKGDVAIKNIWIKFLFILSISNFIGAIIHAFKFSELIKDIIWILLYPLMYSISFILLFFGVKKNTSFMKPTKNQITILLIITLIFDIISSINSFYVVKDMRIYAVFTAIIGIPGLVLILKDSIKRNFNVIYYCFIILILQVIGLIFILNRNFHYIGELIEFDYNAIYHLFLLITVVLLYFIAKSDIENKIKEQTFKENN